jgi:hypothetical protein
VKILLVYEISTKNVAWTSLMSITGPTKSLVGVKPRKITSTLVVKISLSINDQSLSSLIFIILGVET